MCLTKVYLPVVRLVALVFLHCCSDALSNAAAAAAPSAGHGPSGGRGNITIGGCEVIEDHQLAQGDIRMMCSLSGATGGVVIANLSSGVLDNVVKLQVVCSDASKVESSVVTPDNLSGFIGLQDFSMDHCGLTHLHQNFLPDVDRLEKFTIRSHHASGSHLTLGSQAFTGMKQLESLDISTNNIWELPGDFCQLVNLKSLNLSHNHLQYPGQLGFRSVSQDHAHCTGDLRMLDLSYNDVRVVSSGSLSGLSQLQELYLQDNELVKVDDYAFQGLQSLALLDLSNNHLVALPPSAFLGLTTLQKLLLKNNSLSVLADGLFRDNRNMLELDLSHNDLTSQFLAPSSLQGLIRLLLLDISYNKLTMLSSQLFQDLVALQVLLLDHNTIQDLPPGTLSACTNLHRLDLSYNQLATLVDRAFIGLAVLSILSLDNNNLTDASIGDLGNLSSLKDLNLNGNKLTSVPNVVGNLKYLETLDLGENQITSLDNMPVNGSQNLYGLRLVNNKIKGNISKRAFVDMPSLKILNLARNEILHIESGAMNNNLNLQAIRLDANKLISMHGLFDKLPNLQWLNVSDNNIEQFDYHFIPKSLVWLDLHRNKIKELGNYMERHDVKLQTLDASFNKLGYVNQIQIPDSVQLLFLNDNELSSVEPFTFFKKTNLSRVDLFANQITKMDMSALRLSSVPDNKNLPRFYLGGNPFICDCDMEWLQRINSLEHLRHHPTIMDLDSVYCQLTFAKTSSFLPLTDVKASQFLCQYESHCFALCHCCEYDACDCEMTCPLGCTCYHDQSWRTNIVDCSMQDAIQVPDRIPMDVTQTYLDGNMLNNLSPHSFIGRKHMHILYVNNSNVVSIDNVTFSGLTRLSKLHLEDNQIVRLQGNEFKGLEILKELYLHNNKLQYIQQHTFATLLHLEILTLHNNMLTSFPVWRLVDNPYLVQVSLTSNQWSCQCQFVESFGIWLSGNERKVVEGNKLKCSSKDLYISDFNSTTCSNTTSMSTVMQPMILEGLLNPVIAVCAALLFVLLFVFCFLYRGGIKIWIYSKCGCRICHRTAPSDETDKLFDAFVSYSAKDEVWINQVLAGEMEHGVKPYRICLHYRDFPVTAYLAETIVEAVESSRRTIIVLSKNFIENEWCRFQFKSAHHEVLKKKRQHVIVIVLGELPSRELDPDLRLYLKTNTVINASDKLFWDKLRFAMPEVPPSKRIVHTYSTIPERTRSSTNKYSVNSPSSFQPNFRQPDSAYWS